MSLYIAAKKASEANQFWIKHQREVQQKTPERIEDPAKFLSGMISISLTIFLRLNPDGFKAVAGSGLLNLAVILWIASLVFTFLVLFPAPYRYNDSSSASIRLMHKRVVRYKYWMLGLGAFSFGGVGGVGGVVCDGVIDMPLSRDLIEALIDFLLEMTNIARWFKYAPIQNPAFKS